MQVIKHFNRNFIVIVLLLISNALAGQQRTGSDTKKTAGHISQQLGLDPNVRTGKLPNGFTYFIRRNTNPKNRVLFYLANKVGSILEDEDQRGLAHFMEHMNFNGTVHFPKNALIDYLQKTGVRFGADINAYTGFDETVYQLPLPSDNPETVNNGLQVMYDWAQGAILDPIEIDKERGVILEEKRLGKGAQDRMQRQFLPVLFNHSRYGQRLPIGSDSIIRFFKAETLSRFYKDWYRPDLQALIVVGDIDVDQMEEAIRKKFNDLKNPVVPRQRTAYAVGLTGKNQFIKVTDKEMSQTVMQVMIKQKDRALTTKDDYRNYILQELFNSMLRDRYGELSQKKNPPFLGVSAGIKDFVRGVNAYMVNISIKPGETENAFKMAWRETERLKQWGFTPKELASAKKNYLKRITSSFKQKNTVFSATIINEYLQYFLNNVAAPGIEAEMMLSKEAMPVITLEMLNQLIKKSIKDVNRDIIIMAPEKDAKELPSETTLLQWMTDIRKEKLMPYQDDFIDQPLIKDQPLAGKVAKQQAIRSLDATELILSNGAKVIVKPAKFLDNYILVKAFSPGGSSLYNDTDYQSAAHAAYLTATAGIAGYDYSQLNKFLSGSNLAISPYINDYSEGIQAGAATEELETLLQMIYVYFTKPKVDTISFANFIGQSKAGLANRQENPNSVFDDTVSAVISNYHFRRTARTLAKLDQIDLKRSHEIFKERFSNASDFTFSFVGDFEIEKIKPLIEKYIGSLPSNGQHEQPKDLGIHPIPGAVTKTIYKGIEQKATVRLSFSSEFEFNSLNNLTLEALAETIQIRLIERLREEESGVYSPSVYTRYYKIPSERYNFVISFGCAPENVDKLIASTLDEINKLKADGTAAVNLEKFKAETRRKYETNMRKIDFWSGYITDQVLNSEDFNEINKWQIHLNELDNESIKKAAKSYLRDDNLIRLVLMPENFKPQSK